MVSWGLSSLCCHSFLYLPLFPIYLYEEPCIRLDHPTPSPSSSYTMERINDINDLYTSDCTRHECDIKNEHLFQFWMHKLPSSLKTTISSYSLSQISHADKTRAVRSLSPLVIPGTIMRLLEQVANCNNPTTLRRDAFLSLKIVVDV